MDPDQNYDISQILEEMRTDYWRNLETVEEDAAALGEEYLLVQIDHNLYALQASLCREVLKLPRLACHIRGIINLRGEILAVTDMAPILGDTLLEVNADSRLVVVHHGPVKTALLVDGAADLCRIGSQDIEPLAEGAAAGKRDLFKGKVVQKEATLLVLDLAQLLSRPEILIDQKG